MMHPHRLLLQLHILGFLILILLSGCEPEFVFPPTEIPPVPKGNSDDAMVTYEDPEGFPGVPKSALYNVKVRQGLKEKDLVVFQNACPTYQEGYMGMLAKDKNPLEKFSGRSISWVNFSFKGSIEVTVTILDPVKIPMAGQVRILPSRYGVSPVIEDNKITFTLVEPGQFSVEIGENSYKNGLVLFANPVETDVPSTESENYQILEHAIASDLASLPGSTSMLWFKTGVHDIGIYHVPITVKNIYIEGGAWVYGTFIMDGNPDVKIFGRGVLSAGRIDYRASHTVEAINQSDNITLKGIVVEDSKHFSVRLIGMNNQVEWVKVIGGWVYNVDGIAAYAGSNVSHCFIWANDDNIKVYRDNISFSDIVCWQLDNGAIIQMSWGGAVGGSTARNVRISRIDVLHAEWDQSRFNSGLLNCVGNRYQDPGRYALQENWLIENVTTEYQVPQVINIRPNDFTPNHIHGLVLKNWNVLMDMSKGFHNNILGNDPEVVIDGVVFDNFIFNNTKFIESNWMTEGNFVVSNMAAPEFY